MAEQARAAGAAVVTLDVSCKSEPAQGVDVGASAVLSCHPNPNLTAQKLALLPRGEAVSKMAVALSAFLQREHQLGRVAGVIGLGGMDSKVMLTPHEFKKGNHRPPVWLYVYMCVRTPFGGAGSGGTALITPAMRALPIGLPKVQVSTVAAGNTAPYVGTSDLVLMPSVVDVAGINRVSR